MSKPTRVIWIIGASSGIGEALAQAWAQPGTALVLSARRADRLEQLATELRSKGAQVLVTVCDVTQDGDPERALQHCMETFGRLDIAFANAGFGVDGYFNKLSIDDFRRQFETNIFGVIRCAKAAFPELAKTKGRFAITGSVAGHLVYPRGSAYAMSKFAIRALAETLRAEWAGFGVSVTLISPGFVESEIRYLDNQGQPKEGAKDPIPAWLVVPRHVAAKHIVRAVEGRAAERVITGHGKIIVFLSRHFPWFYRLLLTQMVKAKF